MVDSNLFAALPDNIKQGGDLTDQFASLVRKIVSGYSGYYIDPNNPQIGEPDDDTVKAILKVYAPAYNDNVQALGHLADAIVSASDLTTKSGVNFETTQQDAIDHINSTNTRK